MELSVCIITKNECDKLRKCLEALRQWQNTEAGQQSENARPEPAFEIVVVDTGSTDGTKEMASEYTERIYDFTWQDDFALARNYAASKASHDMIMMLDSDEYVQEMDLAALEKAVKAHRGMAGRIRLLNLLGHDGEQQRMTEYISRIYDRRMYHYEGRIHEQIVKISEEGNCKDHQAYPTEVVVLHDGYCGNEEEMRKKIQRNITMLERELADRGEDPYLLYQLGKSHYVAKDFEAAIAAFDRALCQDLNPKLEYVIDMVQAYGYSLLKSGREGRIQQALSLEGIYEEFGNTADFRFLMGLIYMNNGLFDKAVDMFLQATKAGEAYVQGADSYLAFYNAGVICECLGDLEHAKEYYEACGDYSRARERLHSERLISE